MELCVNYSTNRSGKSAKEDFGDWYESCSYDFENITSRGIMKTTIKGNPKIGDILYYVWAEYSTGDSFGHATGQLSEIGLYDEKWKAEEIKSKLDEDYQKFPDNYGQIEDVDGLPVYTGVWKGYFESLTAIHIEELLYEE